jgi:histone acetyltransferase (RNA polymerase elongator complex component)
VKRSSNEVLLKRSALNAFHKTGSQDDDLTTKPNPHRPFIIPIFLPHAGCPHRCVFCDQSSITGISAKQPRRDIRKQIEAFLKFKTARHNEIQIAFFGGNFLGIPADGIKHLLAEAAGYVADGRVNSIRFSTRPDTIDAQRLNLIKNYPVTTIELGAQSMDERVLAAAKRGHQAPDTEKAVQCLKDLRYEVGVQLMVGLPGDTPERAIASARSIVRLKPDFVRIYPTVVLAGSPLAAIYRKGDYVPLRLDAAVSQVKNLYRLFKRENIGVIRMGLQASQDLEDGSRILAGPYHPAFGHLVYSEIFLDMAVEQIKSSAQNSNSISIRTHPSNISKLRGMRNRNIKFLKDKFGFELIAVKPDNDLAEDQLAVDRLT